MLMWSVRELAERSGVSDSSIRRIEAGFGVPENVTLDLLVKLHEFFESRGFRFTFEDGHSGVEWRRNKKTRKDTAAESGSGGPLDVASEPVPPGAMYLG